MVDLSNISTSSSPSCRRYTIPYGDLLPQILSKSRHGGDVLLCICRPDLDLYIAAYCLEITLRCFWSLSVITVGAASDMDIIPLLKNVHQSDRTVILLAPDCNFTEDLEGSKATIFHLTSTAVHSRWDQIPPRVGPREYVVVQPRVGDGPSTEATERLEALGQAELYSGLVAAAILEANCATGPHFQLCVVAAAAKRHSKDFTSSRYGQVLRELHSLFARTPNMTLNAFPGLFWHVMPMVQSVTSCTLAQRPFSDPDSRADALQAVRVHFSFSKQEWETMLCSLGGRRRKEATKRIGAMAERVLGLTQAQREDWKFSQLEWSAPDGIKLNSGDVAYIFTACINLNESTSWLHSTQGSSSALDTRRASVSTFSESIRHLFSTIDAWSPVMDKSNSDCAEFRVLRAHSLSRALQLYRRIAELVRYSIQIVNSGPSKFTADRSTFAIHASKDLVVVGLPTSIGNLSLPELKLVSCELSRAWRRKDASKGGKDVICIQRVEEEGSGGSAGLPLSRLAHQRSELGSDHPLVTCLEGLANKVLRCSRDLYRGKQLTCVLPADELWHVLASQLRQTVRERKQSENVAPTDESKEGGGERDPMAQPPKRRRVD